MSLMMDGETAGTGRKENNNTPYEYLQGRREGGLILVCDHAGNAFPEGADQLGLANAQLERHIAYDIGAAAVTRQLSKHLQAPAILSRYSRLFIDLNRSADDPTLVMRLSDGAVVPGNIGLSKADIKRRIADYYEPYHETVDRCIDQAIEAGRPPVLFSVHSFTDRWKGQKRPWHATVLWDRDPRVPCPVIAELRKDTDLVIGENVPYTGELKGDSMYRHGTQRGIAHALIEIRQDLIRSEAGQKEWAERLARILKKLLSDKQNKALLHRVRYYGSHADDPIRTGILTDNRKETTNMAEIDPKLATEIEAAAFRRLVSHLRERGEVQNIDLMNLAGFCRNCLSNWYREAAADRGLELSKEMSREIVYGMSYDEWKDQHQTEASGDQLKKFAETQAQNGH